MNSNSETSLAPPSSAHKTPPPTAPRRFHRSCHRILRRRDRQAEFDAKRDEILAGVYARAGVPTRAPDAAPAAAVSYSAAFSTAASASAADAIPATATVSVEAAEHALEAQQLLRLLKARAQPFNRRPPLPHLSDQPSLHRLVLHAVSRRRRGRWATRRRRTRMATCCSTSRIPSPASWPRAAITGGAQSG